MTDVNVKVAVRCRPMSSKETVKQCGNIVRMPTAKSVSIQNPADSSTKDFSFDYCYYIDSRQEEVYRDLGEPMVVKALEGFNGTLFAYGQTGSGKSFSMMGGDDEVTKGIIPRLNGDLWEKIGVKLETLHARDESDKTETKIMVTVSFLEIYNEIVRDLLNPSDNQLKIRESPEAGIYVEDLCEVIVRDEVDIMRLIAQGNTVRRVAATNMNEQSSRSHSVFTIKIEQKKTSVLDKGVTRETLTKAKLNLVDLAGSERANKTGATGSTLKEGANINMSLMALGNVINALSEGSKGKNHHIPYRDSKLTRLLQESLGGNSATCMLAAVSPADYNFDETVSTLKYANRAKSISNAVVCNEDVQEKMIQNLKHEIEELKRMLEHGGGGAVDHEAERRLREMEETQKKDWVERERLARELEAQREANMNNVISGMMANVKEQKINVMKEIKRLTNEKAVLGKKTATAKGSCDKLKAKLDKDMGNYGLLQGEYDRLLAEGDEGNKHHTEEVAEEMVALLTTIETDRVKYMADRDELKGCKDRMTAIEEDITAHRGELVATAGILDQNDKLKAQIQEEERLKAKEIIEAEVSRAKELIRLEQGTFTAKQNAEIDKLQSTIKMLQERVEAANDNTVRVSEEKAQLQLELEAMNTRLVEAEVSQETLQGEIDRVNAEVAPLRESTEALSSQTRFLEAATARAEEAHAREVEAMHREHEAALYHSFEALMDSFGAERQQMASKHAEVKAVLAAATQDLMALMRENASLKQSLADAIRYERPLGSGHFKT